MNRCKAALLCVVMGGFIFAGAATASAATSVYHPDEDARTFENTDGGWTEGLLYP